ncbi:hypothetical protein PTSG_11881 [Salpingoeca rosetta]|uniref:Uncharacterized protein n=1 Tax=Salpingoeca rosetta (strain ATCC 50818 / BSB-021) TaxID=946362 RepID=F2U2A8_SALR5|nr:uncharacterized protein PTSG_11881 [Salpingoeca rosetta]EGD81760.1 hypothetical protein PTSG_11881 [Salpingoeca rosetta]|eukprot:XP_004996964.1 hypothetical protein PTSG_11881 [Salpingoeca rosetta]
MTTPKLFRAIADFSSDDAEDLQFRAGATIIVTDQGEGKESWWEGELDGKKGTFPGTFVEPLSKFVRQMGAQAFSVADKDKEEEEEDEEEEEEQAEQGEKQSQQIRQLQASSPTTGRAAPHGAAKRVRFDLGSSTMSETYGKFEYDRSGEFNPDRSHQEWLLEEAEEKLRMLRDRWSYLESKLPRGQKCEERIAYESERLRRLQEARAARRSGEQGQHAGLPGAQERGGAVAAAPQQQQQQQQRARVMFLQGAANDRAPPPSQPVLSLEPTDEDVETDDLTATTLTFHRGSTGSGQEKEEDTTAPAADDAGTRGDSIDDDAAADTAPVTPAVNGSNASTAATPASDTTTATNSSNTDTGDGRTPLDVAIDRLEETIAQLAREDEGGVTGFAREFLVLDQQDHEMFRRRKTEAGEKRRELNRYSDIIPYDATRVMLGPQDSSENYINASHMRNLLPGSPHYIAAQGPLEGTVAHFWKMIAQEKTRVIIMVTNTEEKGRRKCEKYWPDPGHVLSFEGSVHGPAVQVLCKSETRAQAWVRREFQVTQVQDGERVELNVSQLHFTSWPDRGVPHDPVMFLSFLHTAMAAQNAAHKQALSMKEESMPPIVVHCSAGVGRTGVFILVYSILTYLPYVNKGGRYVLNVRETIQRMRKYRRYLVQTVDQYVFCHHTILHATKFYRDGSKRLKQQKRTTTTTTTAAAATASPATTAAAAAVVSSSLEGRPVSVDDGAPTPPSSSSTPATTPGGHRRSPVDVSVDATPEEEQDQEQQRQQQQQRASVAPWHHPELDRPQAEAAIMAVESRSDGLFLLYGHACVDATSSEDARVSLAVLAGNDVHHIEITQHDSGFALGPHTAEDLASLVLQLARAGMSVHVPAALSFFVPHASAAQEAVIIELQRLEEAAQQHQQRQQQQQQQQEEQQRQHQARVAAETSFSHVAPPVGTPERGGSRTSITSASTDVSMEGDGTPRKSSLRSRMKNFKKKLTPRKSKELREATEVKRTLRIAQFSPPDPKVLSSSFKRGGDVLELSGRSHYLTFLNGVYREVERSHRGNPVYKLMAPIDAPHTHLHGEYVFLFMDIDDKAWVFFLPNAGPVACCAAISADPVETDGEWMIVNTRNELVPDAAVHISRLAGVPERRHPSREAESAELMSLREEVQTLRVRLKEASEREHLATKLIQSQKTVKDQLSQSQHRERELAMRLVELQELVASKLGMDDLEELQEAAAKASGTESELQQQLQVAEARIEQLENELAQAAEVETSLRDQINRLSLAEEGLSRRIERLEMLLDEKTDALNQSASNEESLARELASAKVQIAELMEETNAFAQPPTASFKQVLDLSNIDEEDEEEESADEATIKAQQVEAARQKALNAANIFADESGFAPPPKPSQERRGLPAGILWGEDNADGDDDGDTAGAVDDDDDDDDGDGDDDARTRTLHLAGFGESMLGGDESSMMDDDDDDDEDDSYIPIDDQEEYIALQDFQAVASDELSFSRGQTILVTGRQGQDFYGRLNGREGRFPMRYVGTKM